MICKLCSTPLRFRFPGGRKNPENTGHRAGIVILKLVCPNCGEKWLATDAKESHPYQVRHKLPEGEAKKGYSIRMKPRDAQKRIARWGSLQRWADNVE